MSQGPIFHEQTAMFAASESTMWLPLLGAIEEVWARRDTEQWTEGWEGIVAAWDAYMAEAEAVVSRGGRWYAGLALTGAIAAFVGPARRFHGGDDMAVAYCDLMDVYGARFHPMEVK
jgi:hypothetical protein